MKTYNSEAIVLGGLLKNRSMVERISRLVAPQYFQKSDHRILFSELLEYNDNIKEVNNTDWGDVQLFSYWLDRFVRSCRGGE